MVDFKRLSKINQAATEAIAEEEKHRTPLSAEEKRAAELFFLKGSIWERKQCEVIIHENLWWWGKSFTIIINGGKGSVVLRIENERPDAGGICSLMVLESERQKGIGTMLIMTCEHMARRIGLKQIYLDARKGTFVIDWYRKLGFEIYEENPEHSKGNTVCMNKVFTENNRLE